MRPRIFSTFSRKSRGWRFEGKEGKYGEIRHTTVDGSEILQQLRLVVYPIIYGVLYIPGGDRRISEPSAVSKWTSKHAIAYTLRF